MVGHSRELPQGIYTCGIHPWYIEEGESEHKQQFDDLRRMAVAENCIAIGECGCDKLKGPALPVQELVFRKQIRLAQELNKPLVIHCVKMFPLVLRTLETENYRGNFMLHGFNAKPEEAGPFLQMPGAFFSFGVALLQPGSNAETLFKSIPLEKCFLETDDRTIAIKNLYFRAAELKGISITQLSQQLLHNHTKVFVHGTDRER